MGALRGVCLTAREKVCRRRGSSNSAPKWPSPGPPDTRSQHPADLSGAAARLESVSNSSGLIAYLPGLAAVATLAAAVLSVRC